MQTKQSRFKNYKHAEADKQACKLGWYLGPWAIFPGTNKKKSYCISIPWIVVRFCR